MDINIPLNQQQLQHLLLRHPVVTKKYLIITPVITAVYGLIRECVQLRSTGTFMYATPRMGKTTCAKAAKILLENEFPDIFVMKFVAEKRNKQQESAFLTDILESDKLAIPKAARYKDLQRQLFTHIQSSILMRNGQQFVLMVDEMQNLSEWELGLLATIHNRLETIDIKMTTIGFAQPEILNLRVALMATSQSFLIARFLSEPIPFNGCASEKDLESILRAYDEEQYFPEGSDYSFTRFFLPRAYANGYRIITCSKSIWKSLRKAASGLAGGSIPMEHLSRTIEFMLLFGYKNDNDNFKFSDADVDSAVRSSNLAYFSGLMSAPSS